MTETFLAVLSDGNVLRVMSKNGSGIEERAALALGYALSTEQLFELTDMLIQMTAKPDVAPVKPKPAAKAKPKTTRDEMAAKAKAKRQRGPKHTWLKSSTLIRYINENPGQDVPTIAKHLCIALGKEYVTSNKGYGDVVRSRIGNLVNSGKLRRSENGTYGVTVAGMDWADKTDPPPQFSQPDGQELLA
jgi:hypothetical protein